MKIIPVLGLVVATLSAGVAPAMAHHSFSMFDPAQEVVIEGTIVRWQFNNPHTFMMIEDEEGQIWAFEGAAPASLVTRSPSMTGNTFSVGDPLVVIQCPLRDGRAGGAAGIFITADGTVFNPSDGGCNANQRIGDWPAWIAAGFRSLSEAQDAEAGTAEQ